jgi:hypothetical protein
MESSTVVAFRALVLVACLIVVPLAAIFGSQFPDVVKSVLIDRIFPNGLPGSAVAEATRDPAPPFVANGEAPPPWQAAQSTPSAASANAGGPGTAANAAGWSAGGVEPAVAWNQPPGQVRPAGGEGLPGGQPGSAERLGVAVPADGRSMPYGNPGQTPPGNSSAPAGIVPPAAHLVPPTDRFSLMERKLKEAGATYYLLETWGNESEYYRFHCKMAIANNPAHTRPFEATDHDPLRAMQRVVEQVDAWRAGRLP